MGENVPQNQFFRFKSDGMGVFEKKILKLYLVPYPPHRGLYSFLSSDAPFPQKWPCPPPKKKNYSLLLFGKILLFSKKLLNEKYSKRPCLQKKVILIFIARRPLPAMSSHKWVFHSSLKKCCFFRKTSFIIKHPLPNS